MTYGSLLPGLSCSAAVVRTLSGFWSDLVGCAVGPPAVVVTDRPANINSAPRAITRKAIYKLRIFKAPKQYHIFDNLHISQFMRQTSCAFYTNAQGQRTPGVRAHWPSEGFALLNVLHCASACSKNRLLSVRHYKTANDPSRRSYQISPDTSHVLCSPDFQVCCIAFRCCRPSPPTLAGCHAWRRHNRFVP